MARRRSKIQKMDDYLDEADLVEVETAKASESQSGKKERVCDTCLKTFRTSKELKTHIRVHTNERPYKCKECGKAFKQHGALADHLNTHTGLKKHACKVCGGEFATGSSLRRHDRQIHGREKTFACPLCGDTFLNKSAYFKHKDAHYAAVARAPDGAAARRPDGEDGGRLRCPACDKTFARRDKLNAHMDVHMEKTERCEPCQRTFTRLAFKRHLAANHHALRCGVCGEARHNRRLHSLHVRRHFSVASDVCDYCGERFVECGELAEHMRQQRCGRREAARKEKARQCQICVKAYRSVDHLRQHQDFAHVECPQCHKLFTYYAAMQTHFTNTHRAFRCTRCRLVLRSKSHLAFHLNAAHLIITKFSCGICGSRFPRYKYLRLHLEAHDMIKEAGINTLPIFGLCVNQEKTETTNTSPKKEASNGIDSTEKVALNEKQYHPKDVDANLSENEPPETKKSHTVETITAQMEKHRSHIKEAKPSRVKKKGTDSLKNKQNKGTKTTMSEIREKEAADATQTSLKVLVDAQKEVRCQFCSLVTVRKHLQKHCSSKHGKHLCPACLEVFFSETHLQDHQCQQQKLVLTDCTVCGVGFPTRKRLSLHVKDKHMGLVNKRLKYKCSYCSSYLVDKNTLMRHQYLRHLHQLPQLVRDNYAGQVVVCPVCKELVNSKLLIKHMKGHRQSEVTGEAVDPVINEEVNERES